MYAKPSLRLHSLDTMRGIAIAGMLLVNTASLAPAIHPWLAHAHWHGFTLADGVFPCFLFIVGVAMAFSLAKYRQGQHPTRALYWRLLRRGAMLFALGVLLNGFMSPEWGKIGLTGVLQRISFAYLTTAAIVLNLPRRVQWGITISLLLGYWAAATVFPIPEPTAVAGLARAEVGTFGMMSIFGMMSTTAIVLMGYFTGAWLQAEVTTKSICTSAHSMTMVLFGLSGIVLGQLWGLVLPINKKLWTSSYALCAVGLVLLLLAVCYELIEVRRLTRWSQPLQVLGSNAIVVFVGSELTIKLLEKTQIGSGSNAPCSYHWLYDRFSNWLPAPAAGFGVAALVLLGWWLVADYLYRKHWSISI
jgi:predicted acyltransferase